MLKPAILYKDELTRLMIDAMENPRNFYYNVGQYYDYDLSLQNSNWNGHHYVSIVPQGQRILGYVHATIDRTSNSITNLGAISFENSPSFAKDLMSFLHSLFFRFGYNKMKWRVIVGSPHEKTYDRICKRFGGRIVGVFSDDTRLTDGNLYDLKWYEVKKTDLEKHMEKVNKIKNEYKIHSW